MTTDELEELLEGAQETPSLEFKRAMDWEPGLIKDILAMANLQDGGRIVIGVEDATFLRQGLSEDQLQTYDTDIIRDRVATYADPFVELTCFRPFDRGGRQYVVIQVATFRENPVICRKDGGRNNELRAGDIYYRSPARRPRSARIDSSVDMRDLIELAAVRRMRRLNELGLEAPRPTAYDYNGELGGL